MDVFELLFFVVFAGLGVGCWFLMPKGIARWFWVATFVVIELTVVVSEIISKITTGHTISQLFWQFSEASPGKAWLCLGMLGTAFLLLLWHLAAKMLGKKK